ncbi:hypothetical protein PESHB5_20510 [Pediococcus parvulus]
MLFASIVMVPAANALKYDPTPKISLLGNGFEVVVSDALIVVGRQKPTIATVASTKNSLIFCIISPEVGLKNV